MAYLHCHDCDWSQDDFYSPEDYNPFRESDMAGLRRDLFRDEIRLERKTVTGREFVIMELERMIARIKTMEVMTNEEWQKVKQDWKCPKCKSKNWDID